MKSWNEVEALIRKIVWDKYRVTDEYLSEMWLAYTKACETYDPLKAQFTTHLRHTVLGHFADYFKYNSRLVHIPVDHQKTESHSYVSFDTPITENGEVTLGDIIASPHETSSDALEAWILEELASMYPSQSKGRQKALKAIQREITDGEKPPRSLRTEISAMKRKIFDIYKRKYLSNGT